MDCQQVFRVLFFRQIRVLHIFNGSSLHERVHAEHDSSKHVSPKQPMASSNPTPHLLPVGASGTSNASPSHVCAESICYTWPSIHTAAFCWQSLVSSYENSLACHPSFGKCDTSSSVAGPGFGPDKDAISSAPYSSWRAL